MIKIIKAKTSLGSNNHGTELAPDTLFRAGLESVLKENSLQFEEVAVTSKNYSEQKNGYTKNLNQIVRLNKNIFNETLSGLKSGKKTILLGGDHSTAIGSMFATKKFNNRSVVVYIDAHPDLQSPETSKTGNAHGMPLATVLGDSLYPHFTEYKPFKKSEVLLIGIKDIDPAESEYIKKNKIKSLPMEHTTQFGIGATVDELLKWVDKRPVHLSLDIDSIDHEYAPGTGIINKGGFTYREIKYLCKRLSSTNILSIDVVEVNPKKDVGTKTIDLTIELIVNLLGGEWSPYQQYINSSNK
ncbi:MAG: arginase [Candidatus Vogelbacteria bacterium]|nr:arginase [Candidatus Vogelbacteria bacterium]